MAPTAPQILGLKRAPIDVYKKVSVLRSPTDFVVYEDSEGRLQRINDLGQSEAVVVGYFCEFIYLDRRKAGILNKTVYFRRLRC